LQQKEERNKVSSS